MTCSSSLKQAVLQALAWLSAVSMWSGALPAQTAGTVPTNFTPVTNVAHVANVAKRWTGENEPVHGLAAVATASLATKTRPDEGGLTLEGVTFAPFSRARVGHPITLVAIVSNSSSTPRSVVAVAKIVSVPDTEAAALVEIPSHQQRSIELRLRVPESHRGNSIETSVSLNDPENPSQVLLGGHNKPLVDERRINVLDDPLITALVMNPPAPPEPEWFWPRNELSMEYEWVVAARVDSLHSRRTLSVDHVNLPTQVADWQGFDQIVISNDRPFQDPAVVDSMKRWISSGGRAWIMFDQVSPANVRKILSAGTSCEMLDDVELNRFVVVSTVFGKLNEGDRTVEVDQPIRMRRVVQRGGEVTLATDGYPLAIWYPVGRGLVLLTTLAPEAWIVPRKESRGKGDDFEAPFKLRPWAIAMADRFNETTPIRSPIEDSVMQYPLQQIGNPVLNRNYVLSVVFGFCGLLGVVTILCWLTNHMLRLVWVIPVVSILATAPLLISSARLRRDIPDTSAHLQLIEVQPGSQTIQAFQWTASYMQKSAELKLQGTGDATVSWPKAANPLDLRRWTWLDYDQWELASSGWPNGLWQLQSRYALPKQKLDVLANIDEQGLHIQLPAALEQSLQDAVVQMWPGDPVPCGTLERTQHLQVPEGHLSQVDSWLTTTIVNDEQRRRDQVYHQLQAIGRQPGFPSYHALMGWTNLWASPVHWSDSRDERGAALVVLPINLQPTPSGQRVHVPHTVIHIENDNADHALSTAFSNASGWWRDATTSRAEVSMRCTLPRQVCPLDATEINVHLQLRAPQRPVRLYGVLPSGDKQLLKEFVNASGSQTVRIVDAVWLKEIRDGVVDLELDIETADQQAQWQVDYFRLSVDGQVAER